MAEVQTPTSRFDQLEIADIEKILGLIRDRVQKLTAKENAKREAARKIQEGEVVRIECPAKQTDPRDWIKQTALRDEIVEAFEKETGNRRSLQPSPVHQMAERVKTSDEQIYFRPVRTENERKFSYRRDLALTVRSALLDLMRRERGTSEVSLFEGFRCLVVIEAIRDYLKEKGITDFGEYIDEKGDLVDSCQASTKEVTEKIYSQLRVPVGYRDPQELVDLINAKKPKNEHCTSDDVMQVARQLGEGKSQWFRPAIRRFHEPQQTTTIHNELYQLVLEHFLGVSAPKPDWPSVYDVKRTYGLEISIDGLRGLMMRLGPVDADIQMHISARGKKTTRFSPDFVQTKVLPGASPKEIHKIVADEEFFR